MIWYRLKRTLCAWNKVGIALINTTHSDQGLFPKTKKQHLYEKFCVIEFQQVCSELNFVIFLFLRPLWLQNQKGEGSWPWLTVKTPV